MKNNLGLIGTIFLSLLMNFANANNSETFDSKVTSKGKLSGYSAQTTVTETGSNTYTTNTTYYNQNNVEVATGDATVTTDKSNSSAQVSSEIKNSKTGKQVNMLGTVYDSNGVYTEQGAGMSPNTVEV